ncbi:hypothetical protein [Nocardia terpenica]|uniref:hypothetical protein n=1 Tax=Nocardia terpenica TaxID=455432 RepID=UPI002FE3B2DE
MNGQLDRRSLLTLTAAGVLAPALAACGDGNKHDRPATAATAAPVPGSGPLPNVVMIIRHAEKPTGDGAPYGLTEAGEHDKESLTVRGWTRAGALTDLFAPRAADGGPAETRPGLFRPATIFASDPVRKGGSKRPLETVTPLAAALNVQVDTRFAKGQEAALAAALPGLRSPVLISWQHENIDAILAQLGAIHPAPPAKWPGERFDMVYVLIRNGDGWNFTQVPQLLLAGDSATPIA